MVVLFSGCAVGLVWLGLSVFVSTFVVGAAQVDVEEMGLALLDVLSP